VIVFSSGDPALSLTAQNASSSLPTLKAMLIISAIGLPIVAGFTISFYGVFKGIQLEY